jgi:hypothetical protein
LRPFAAISRRDSWRVDTACTQGSVQLFQLLAEKIVIALNGALQDEVE